MPLQRFQATPDGTPTAQMVASYQRDGFLIIEGMKSHAECDALRAAMNGLIDGFDPESVRTVFEASGSQSHAADRYFQESGDKIRFFFEKGAFGADGRLVKPKHAALNKVGHALHDLDPDFDAFSRDTRLANLVSGLGLADPGLIQSMYIFKPPHIGGEVNCHQDSTFLHTTPISTTGLWFALEDADETNGCLFGIPGVQDVGLKERFHYDGDRLVMTKADETPWPTGRDEPLTAPKGTLVVLHGLAPHKSGPNLSPRSRHAYALHVIDRAATWSSDNWLRRGPDRPVSGF
ncbi:MAG: phytanoyl-CoA dioxygenase family protein [Alphaproteobacteria bacterium]